MSDFTEKVRAMLDKAKQGNWSFCRYAETDKSWLKREIACLLDNEGAGDICYFVGTDDDLVVALTGNGPTSAQNAELIADAPTLLREACEYIEALEELYEIVRWEKECEDFQRPPSRKFQTHLGHISWLDAKKAKDNWKSKGWRSLARIYGNAWMQKQDAISALDAKELP